MASQPSNFEAAWTKFYQTSDTVLNPKPSSHGQNKGKRRQRRRRPQQQQQQQPLSPNQLQKILSLLLSLSKLLSSVPLKDKAHACRTGALEIIVRACEVVLSQESNRNPTTSLSILQSGCKALQTCVFKNPAARSLCIYHGILPLLAKIVARAEAPPDLQDEAFTTVAAVCLGNDLNALVASIQFEALVVTQNNNSDGRLHQTLSYLQTLFRVVQREQTKLLNHCCDRTMLPETILAVDTDLQTAIQLQANRQWTQAEAILTRALEQALLLASHTDLLDDWLRNAYEKRSAVRLQLEDWTGVLSDVQEGLQLQEGPSVVALLARRADALVGLEWFGQAQEALDQAIGLSLATEDPSQRRALVHKRNQLQLSKQQQARDRKRHTKNRVHPQLESCYNHEPQHAEESTVLVKPGASVNCLYGTGVVQEVRKCGTTKIKLKSWFPGRQSPTAYLMPEFYTVLPVAE